MHEFFATYLEPLLTFIAGGGLVAIVKWRSIKKQAEAEALAQIQIIYQLTIKDLREDKEMMKRDNAELREIVSELQVVVNQNSKDITELKGYKCIVMNCQLRRKD